MRGAARTTAARRLSCLIGMVAGPEREPAGSVGCTAWGHRTQALAKRASG